MKAVCCDSHRNYFDSDENVFQSDHSTGSWEKQNKQLMINKHIIN